MWAPQEILASRLPAACHACAVTRARAARMVSGGRGHPFPGSHLEFWWRLECLVTCPWHRCCVCDGSSRAPSPLTLRGTQGSPRLGAAGGRPTF